MEASLPVDVWERDGRTFEVVMASDVINDGSGFDFMAHHATTLPFEVVERFVAAVRKDLPPSDGF